MKKVDQCPKLKANIERLRDSFNLPDIEILREEPRPDNLDAIIGETFSLGIYLDNFDQIASEYKIPQHKFFAVKKHLELAAIVYVGLAQKKRFHKELKGIIDHLKKIESKAKALERLLEPGREDWKFLYTSIALLGDDPINIDDILDSSLTSLSALKNLRKQFQGFEIVKSMEYGKQATLGNPGLEQWVHLLVKIWLDVLERTTINPNDGINGRIHLYHFMCDCMEPVHESLEYSTIDHMLRKVQRSLRQN